ncbi:MAG: hypothetical protein ABJG68_02680 [Crocinitomicaceae bacterium]
MIAEDTLEKLNSTEYTIGDFTIRFTDETISDCNGLELMIPPNEEDYIDTDKSVFRVGDKLFFILNSGDTTVLANEPFDEENPNYNESAIYRFVGSVEGINHWEIFTIGYECHYTILLNKDSGNITKVIGRPVASPSSELILCGNPDLESGYTINGFDLVEYKKDRLLKIGQLELLDWGPYECSWKNDSVAIIKKGIMDETYTLRKSCIEMHFIKNGG